MGKTNSDDLVWELRELSSEISALGHLIRSQKPEEASLEDLEEMNNGLGLVLGRIARRVRRASREVERRGGIVDQ